MYPSFILLLLLLLVSLWLTVTPLLNRYCTASIVRVYRKARLCGNLHDLYLAFYEANFEERHYDARDGFPMKKEHDVYSINVISCRVS